MINTVTPHSITTVAHPYAQEELEIQASRACELILYHAEPNQIVDEEDWFDRYGLTFPEAIDPRIPGVPQSTRFGNLRFLRAHDNHLYAVYETVYTLTAPKDIYNEGHVYTLIVFDNTSAAISAFDLKALFPDILEMCWFEAIDDLIYFNTTYNGYADIRDNKTGYLYCLDITRKEIVWSTRNLISSYRGFTVHKDHVLTGYGFTAEPDFLYIIDRFNGDITQTIPIKTAHEHIIIKNSMCYVRTYNMNYVYTIKE
jgi:hypothetical protein